MGIKTGAPISMRDIRGEVSDSSSAVSINDTLVRDLAYRRTSGEVLSFSQFAGNFKKGAVMLVPFTYANGAIPAEYSSPPLGSQNTFQIYQDTFTANGGVMHYVMPLVSTQFGFPGGSGLRPGIVSTYPNGSIISTRRLRLGSTENTSNTISQNTFTVTLSYTQPNAQTRTMSVYAGSNTYSFGYGSLSNRRGTLKLLSATDKINTLSVLNWSNSTSDPIANSFFNFYPGAHAALLTSAYANGTMHWSRLLYHASHRNNWNTTIGDSLDHNRFGHTLIYWDTQYGASEASLIRWAHSIVDTNGNVVNTFVVASNSTVTQGYQPHKFGVTDANNIFISYFPQGAFAAENAVWSWWNSNGTLIRARAIRSPHNSTHSGTTTAQIDFCNKTGSRYISFGAQHTTAPAFSNGSTIVYRAQHLLKLDTNDNIVWGRRYYINNGQSWYFATGGKDAGIYHTSINAIPGVTVDPDDGFVILAGDMKLTDNSGQFVSSGQLVTQSDITFEMCVESSNGNTRYINYNFNAGGLVSNTIGYSFTSNTEGNFYNIPLNFGANYFFLNENAAPGALLANTYVPMLTSSFNTLTVLGQKIGVDHYNSSIMYRYTNYGSRAYAGFFDAPISNTNISAGQDYKLMVLARSANTGRLINPTGLSTVNLPQYTNTTPTYITANSSYANGDHIHSNYLVFEKRSSLVKRDFNFTNIFSGYVDPASSNTVTIYQTGIPAADITGPIKSAVLTVFPGSNGGAYNLNNPLLTRGYTLNTSLIVSESNTTANIYSITVNSVSDPFPFFPRAVANLNSTAADASYILQTTSPLQPTDKAYDVRY